jgi:hypothetical protein
MEPIDFWKNSVPTIELLKRNRTLPEKSPGIHPKRICTYEAPPFFYVIRRFMWPGFQLFAYFVGKLNVSGSVIIMRNIFAGNDHEITSLEYYPKNVAKPEGAAVGSPIKHFRPVVALA